MSNQSWSTALALGAAALLLGACHHAKDQSQAPGGAAASDGAAASGAANAERDGGDASAEVARIKCFGVNECAGQAACDVPDNRVAPGSKGHACAGQNECRGKGWVLLASDACATKGGQPL